MALGRNTLICLLVLVFFVVLNQSKPVENTNVASHITLGDEMMTIAESQNPFLPRFAMKRLKERRQEARAQRRNNSVTRRQEVRHQIRCPQPQKMKGGVLLVLMGIVGVIAKPAENLTLEPFSENSTSETTEASVDNNKPEADLAYINEILIDNEKQSKYGTTIDVFMEEELNNPDVLVQGNVPNFDSQISDDNDEILYNDVLNKDANEILDTAAGFLPVPIIRPRQKSKRRFATRRNFRRKYRPFSRVFFFYPSYGFYPQSSLRYY